MKNNSEKKPNRIIVYGFDILGFDLPDKPMEISNNFIINYISFSETVKVEDYDGLIIPQGIFEKIEYHRTAVETFTDVNVEKDLLLEREREIFNMIKEDKWVCFLVQKIIDSIPSGYFETKKIRNTDLCKRVLNLFNIERNIVNGLTLLDAKSNEFISYISKFGVANTSFNFSYNTPKIDKKIIVTSGNLNVGFELLGKIFFLPFHTTIFDSDNLINISKILTTAIGDYRFKHKILLPAWLDDFKFKNEISIGSEIDEIYKKSTELQSELSKWINYKSILTVSGEILRKKIIEILEEYFSFNVDPIDEGGEDAKIIDENSKPIFLIEVKGTNKGVKREHINQLDSHREGNDLTEITPGILIINNEMKKSGIVERLDTKVPKEQIKHAKRLNVLIVRTIDLLFVMKNLEENKNRTKILSDCFNSGGGWLKANNENYEIIQ